MHPILHLVPHTPIDDGNEPKSRPGTAGFDAYFVDRTAGVYPTAASGFPYSAASMACKGDLIAGLTGLASVASHMLIIGQQVFDIDFLRYILADKCRLLA